MWVSDQFEVMLRTGPSTSNAIERMSVERNRAGNTSSETRRPDTHGFVLWQALRVGCLRRYLMNEAKCPRTAGSVDRPSDQACQCARYLTDVRSWMP